MKLSYKHNLAAVATAVVIFNLTSCKYEDGPKISLRSKTARLTGEWEATKVIGEDPKDLGIEIEMEFDKDGDITWHVTYSYYGYSYDFDLNGEWEWGSGKESIEMDIEGDSYEYEIKRLTNSELWMEDEDKEDWELEKI